MKKIIKTIVGPIMALSLAITPACMSMVMAETPEFLNSDSNLADELPVPEELTKSDEIAAACPEGYKPIRLIWKNNITTHIGITDYYKKIDEGSEINQTPPILSIGDLDQDGKITMKDAKKHLKITLGIEEKNTMLTIASDMNHDGVITLEDTCLILKYALSVPIYTPNLSPNKKGPFYIEGVVTEVGTMGGFLIQDEDKVGSDYHNGIQVSFLENAEIKILKDGVEVSRDAITVGTKVICNYMDGIAASAPGQIQNCTLVIIQ